MTKIEQLEQKIQDLERRLCCDKARFYSELSSFPSVGKEKVLYIDESTGDIYVWDGTQYTTADVLDKYHTHVVGTGVYNPLRPLTGWVAPSSPIEGNTVEVKFTDGTVGNYTFDGTVWGLDFANIKPKTYKALLTQSGTNDPIAIVLENTLGEVVPSWDGTGSYLLTSNELFTIDRTSVTIGINPIGASIFYEDILLSTILIGCIDGSGTRKDNVLNNHLISIEVYP